MNPDDQLLAELDRLETEVWTALVQGDKHADEQALHTDFLGVYSDGFATKADHIQQLDNGPTIQGFALSNQRVLSLGHDHAVFSYKADFVRASRTASEAMYVSSIWRRTGDGWVNVFSQDTPATG